MAIFRCKMCGGDLEIQDGATSCVCEFCGTRQTLPTNQDENLQGLFNRANVLRIKSEFDKAADIYEKILQADQTEAEAYWGLILCKYGIEYVEDPATYKRIPTCHRASYDAVTTDEDYKNALKYADTVQREIYESEAAKIEEIQKGILAIAQKESPYDVFICYKETDDSGNRTQDSVIANDIYYQLKNEGFKVFYAAISLEDKLGSEYEPVIFSALNTAKVMLVLGTKPVYFNAVWVKNEWSRFLKLMKKDRSRLMIPCYMDMDPYELPDEFAHLQAQNMGKIGFINDLVRGIKKVIGKEQSQPEAVTMPVTAAAPVYTSNVNALLKRGNMALEDGEWEKADDFFEQVLNQDAECAEAYLGKYLATNRQSNTESMISSLVSQYQGANSEFIEAFPADEEHIQIMVNKYSIPYYLPSSKISSRYVFNKKMESEVNQRIRQKTDLLTSFTEDRYLKRYKLFAKESEKEKYNSWIVAIEHKMDDYILQAQDVDNDKSREIRERYDNFIKKQDCDVQELYEEASHLREQDYQFYLKLLNSSEKNPSKLKWNYKTVADHLSSEGLKNYKDSETIVKQCRQAHAHLLIEEQIEKENKEHRKKIIEIGLIIALVIIFVILIKIAK